MESVQVEEHVVESSAKILLDLNDKIRVLHVDDDSGFLKLTKQCLEMEGPIQVDTALSVEEALMKLEKDKYDIVVSDYQMPGRDGLDFLKTLRTKKNAIPFIMFTGKGREEVAKEALNLGANQYLNKVGETETVYVELAHTIRELAKTARAEEALRKSEGKLRAIVASSPDAISVFDLAGNVIEINEAAMRLHGFSKKEDILGKSSLDYVAPRDRSRARKLYGTMIKKGGAKEAQFTLLTVDGREIYAEVSASVVRDRNGVPICVAVVLKDVTERRRTEERIRQSEQRYKELFENAYDAILAMDLNGRVTEANNAILRYGYRKEDVVGNSILDLVPRKYHKVLMKDFSEAMRGKPVKNDIEIETPNGALWGEYCASVLLREGNVAGVQVIIRGLYERKQFERTLTESQQRFKGLFMGNPEAAAYLGPDYHVLEINPRFEELFGYSLEEIRGKHINDVLVPNSNMSEAEALDKKAVEGYVYHNTKRRRKDGLLVPVAVSAAPIIVEGKPAGFVAMYKDISDLKDVEKRLETMNEKLQVVGGLTRHDVRNKLSVITGNAYLLRKQLAGDSGVLEKLEAVETAVKQTVRILEFAKAYESLGVEKLVYMNVEKTIDEAVALFPNFKGIEMINKCAGLTLLADSLLQQMFYNLIDNTLKYGQKTTKIEVHYEQAGSDELRLVYEDNGVGIPETEKAKLFKEGYSTGGSTGYGLHLIKKMIEVYGWTIQENGKTGKGALFTITVPKTNQNGKENYNIRQCA
jgi:PAS domain S-box-containing protein